MDPDLFLEAANTLKKLPMFPYLDIAHYAITCMSVREDLGSGSIVFSRKHPLACWFSSIFACFAGGVLANFLLGEPILAPFKDIHAIFLATAVWYLIFYSPFDLTYKICKFLPFYCVLGVAKELTRVKKVHDGVVHAQHAYPDSSAMLIWVIIGAVKGAGSGIIRFVERFMRGTWNPATHELLQPTFATKASILGALVFALEGRSEYLTQPHALVYAGVAIFFIWSKLIYLIFHLVDPMLPLENLFCAIFMGGIWDAFSRALSSVGKPNLLGGKASSSTISSSSVTASALSAPDTTVLNGVAGVHGKELKSE